MAYSFGSVTGLMGGGISAKYGYRKHLTSCQSAIYEADEQLASRRADEQPTSRQAAAKPTNQRPAAEEFIPYQTKIHVLVANTLLMTHSKTGLYWNRLKPVGEPQKTSLLRSFAVH